MLDKANGRIAIQDVWILHHSSFYWGLWTRDWRYVVDIFCNVSTNHCNTLWFLHTKKKNLIHIMLCCIWYAGWSWTRCELHTRCNNFVIILRQLYILGVIMYKSIMIGNHERTREVIRNAMMKHGLEGSPDSYSLSQVLPDKGKNYISSH